MSNPTFRALCAELLQPLAEYDDANPYHDLRALINRAHRHLAAEPVGVAPTRPDCFELAMDFLGGLEETEVRRYVEALEACLTIQPEPVADNTRQAVYAAVAEALGSAYDCLRVWEAWGYGTMGPDDFSLVAEDDDRVAEIADAAIEAIHPAIHPVPVARPEDEYHEDMGPVLWWRFPIDEPPYCGSPLDSEWPGYHTHFTPLGPMPTPANNTKEEN